MDHSQDLWDQSSGTFSPPTLKKVLEQMRPPEACDLHQPLVCYWSAMHPTGDDEPFFSQPTPSRWCAMVWVFSMSAYLRNLRAAGERRVAIEMPQANARMKWLQQLFPAL
jgi:hypothetical protein